MNKSNGFYQFWWRAKGIFTHVQLIKIFVLVNPIKHFFHFRAQFAKKWRWNVVILKATHVRHTHTHTNHSTSPDMRTILIDSIVIEIFRHSNENKQYTQSESERGWEHLSCDRKVFFYQNRIPAWLFSIEWTPWLRCLCSERISDIHTDILNDSEIEKAMPFGFWLWTTHKFI